MDGAKLVVLGLVFVVGGAILMAEDARNEGRSAGYMDACDEARRARLDAEIERLSAQPPKPAAV